MHTEAIARLQLQALRAREKDWRLWQANAQKFLDLAMTKASDPKYQEWVAEAKARDPENTFIKMSCEILLEAGHSEDSIKGMIALIFS